MQATKARPKPIKITEAELKRQYEIPSTYHLRWHGLKGVMWYFFSRYIRIRDFLKYKRCISCDGLIEDWKNSDAGHYVAVSHCGFALLFHPKAVNMQCKRCNNPTWTPDAAAGYSHGLDRRYGKGTAEKLWAMKYLTTKEWSQPRYVVEIGKLVLKLNQFELVTKV